MTVTPATARMAYLGAQTQLTATVTDSDGRPRDQAVTWSSTDESVATVDVSGLITAVSNGITTISAKVEDVSGDATVTVAQEIASVVVSPRLSVLSVGEAMTVDALAFDSGGSPIDDPDLGFTTRVGGVATMSGPTLTAVGEGVTDAIVAGGGGTDSTRVVVVHGEGLAVDARSDLFGAGRQSLPGAVGGAGVLPPAVAFAARSGQRLSFSLAVGSVNCCAGLAAYEGGPDGSTAFSTDITSLNGISGLIHDQRSLFLAGVFLDESTPVAPGPSRLDVSSAEAYPTITPELNQAFFIGDARTQAGEIQTFEVPAGATRFFLGFADAGAFKGSPGYYDDNTGQLSVKFRIVDARD